MIILWEYHLFLREGASCSAVQCHPTQTRLYCDHCPPHAVVVVVAGSRFKFERVLNVIYGPGCWPTVHWVGAERQPAEVVSLPSFNKFNYPNYA